MTKKSFQKMSILGLVLMGASAVTAAILPKADTRVFASGHLNANSTGGSGDALKTCKAVQAGEAVDCDFTATNNVNSFTTGGQGTSADVLGTTGALNTGLIVSGGIAKSR